MISPSWAGPAVFPHVHDLGLQRLRDVFGLEPVELPTTRRLGASVKDRAADVEAAFRDPTTTAVLATIGGDDQIRLLRHVDPDVLRAHPKRFLGYSDNTNLLMHLWNAGVTGVYGGSTMVQLGRSGSLHPATEASLRLALLGSGPAAVPELAEWGDDEAPWDDPAFGAAEPVLEPAEPWQWHGPATAVSGRSWGGCLEIIDFQLRAGRWIQDPEAYDGCVLLLETSEELPDATYVSRVLTGMGERGLLERFGAVLVAKPRTRAIGEPRSEAQRRAYVEAQREAVLTQLLDYAPHAPVVLGLDFGHTDPQVLLPYGGVLDVDPCQRTVTAHW